MPNQQVPRGGLTVHVFPHDDLALESVVRRTVRDVFDSRARPSNRLATTVARLREHYPDVVIRQREALAEIVNETTVWYVYRDGGLLRSQVLGPDALDKAGAQRRSATLNVTRGRVECSVCGACRWSRSSDRVVAIWKNADAITDYVSGPDHGNTAWTCDQCGLRAASPVAALLSEVAPRAQI